jgi:hypothetical protein
MTGRGVYVVNITVAARMALYVSVSYREAGNDIVCAFAVIENKSSPRPSGIYDTVAVDNGCGHYIGIFGVGASYGYRMTEKAKVYISFKAADTNTLPVIRRNRVWTDLDNVAVICDIYSLLDS